MRITLGPSVVRGNIDETITGLWTFANVLGLLTDIIGERTAAAGVTVDGLLIKDGDVAVLAALAQNEIITGNWTFDERIAGGDGIAFDTLPLATSFAVIARIIGDMFGRFTVTADGKMTWGDGAGARDVNLFRSAPGVIRTDDTLVGGAGLVAEGRLILSVAETALSSQTNDFSLGLGCIQRFTLSASLTFTGMIAVADQHIIYLVNADSADTLTIGHEHTGSAAANRIILAGAVNRLLLPGETLGFWYDGTSNRWRQLDGSV